MAIMMITHDLGVIAETASRVVIMYAGQVVEEASVEDIFCRPAHPYTIGLQQSIPRVGDRGRPLEVIPGRVPSPSEYPSWCRFADRCRFVEDRCRGSAIGIRDVGAGHCVRCWKDVGDPAPSRR